jgi:hypothetical protein
MHSEACGSGSRKKEKVVFEISNNTNKTKTKKTQKE